MKKDRLSGVRVGVLAADGFEQIEVTVPVRALRKAGADVRIISLRPGRIRGMNLMWRGGKIPADHTLDDIRPEELGAVYIPGGYVNPDFLRQSESARRFVQELQRLGRPIASMCHGPQLLISAGLVGGRRLASWPAIADDVRNAGGIWVDEPVVQDENWLTSRGPHDLPTYSRAMVEFFAERATRELAKLPRKRRWLASAGRVAAYAGAAGIAIALSRRASEARRSLRSAVRRAPLDVLGDLGLAAAFGGTLFSKLALDDALQVLPDRGDRGALLLSAFRRYSIPAAVGLSLATIGWFGGRRRRVRSNGTQRLGDGLLAGALATGLINFVSLQALTRQARRRPLPLESGRAAAPEASTPVRGIMKAGTTSGIAHAAALAGLIGVTSAAGR
jgi:protease I